MGDLKRTIKLPNFDAELTVESSEHGPRVTLEYSKELRLSFTLPPESAERVIRALEGALIAQRESAIP